MESYDVIVIGAGQGGVPLAGAFARAGRRTALVEQMHVGGTCVNEGCSPTKTMVASARVAHVVRRASTYGVRAEVTGVDMGVVRRRKQGIVESFRSGSERGLERSGVELIRATARFTAPRTIAVSRGDSHTSLTAGTVVIDTGLVSAIPPLPGLADAPYLTSSSIMELDEVPEHLVVLGGGYVGLEFAQMFHRFGSRVTVLQRDAQLLPREDQDVAEEVANILRADGIDVRFGVQAREVRHANGEVELSCVAGSSPSECRVRGTHLLVATGRAPNTATLNLAAGGVDVDAKGFVRVTARLETSSPGVFALGDVTGGPAFTHVSFDDYRILRTNLLEGGRASTEGRILPYTVFIDPQLGRVGMTERDAVASGKDPRREAADEQGGAGPRGGRDARLHEGRGGRRLGSDPRRRGPGARRWRDRHAVPAGHDGRPAVHAAARRHVLASHPRGVTQQSVHDPRPRIVTKSRRASALELQRRRLDSPNAKWRRKGGVAERSY
jgi:pyruvate/2-oxoglutarate dehydrogenase complex dihydrolipoamide dehydrogenase (E3) component